LILSSKFDEALTFAASLHRHQHRKGTPTPYLSHLLAVSSLVLEHGGSEVEAVAALLHDAVEDYGETALSDIRERFGEEVSEVVLGCTDSQEEPRPPWRKRKEHYLQHLRHATPSVLLVASADKLHNARSILLDYRHVGEELWLRFAGGREGVLWYYSELVKTLREAGAPARLVSELERSVQTLSSLAHA
jgi:(p)ppGpp synthase/HD superfamily hydrolase